MLREPEDGLVPDRAVDAALVRRARDGDRRAFGVLLGRHEPAMRRAAAAITRHAADTDDAVQEGALRAWTSLASLEDPAKARAWMVRIASREALRLVMARRRGHELSEDAATVAGPDQDVERLDARRRLRTALATLPDQQRRCWVLRELEGLSYRRIAEELGIRETTVRGALAAARRSVAAAMDGLGPAPRVRSDVAAVPQGLHEGFAATDDSRPDLAVAPASARRVPSRRQIAAVRVHVDPSGRPVGASPTWRADPPARLRTPLQDAPRT